jgi:hypothetical protein
MELDVRLVAQLMQSQFNTASSSHDVIRTYHYSGNSSCFLSRISAWEHHFGIAQRAMQASHNLAWALEKVTKSARFILSPSMLYSMAMLS